MHRALGDEGGGRRRLDRVDLDLLRIERGIERQLVAGARRRGETKHGGEGGGEPGAERGAAAAAPHLHAMPQDQAVTFGQVLSIQVKVRVLSSEGAGQFGGAVMLRMGMVIMRFGSRIWNS